MRREKYKFPNGSGYGGSAFLQEVRRGLQSLRCWKEGVETPLHLSAVASGPTCAGVMEFSLCTGILRGKQTKDGFLFKEMFLRTNAKE